VTIAPPKAMNARGSKSKGRSRNTKRPKKVPRQTSGLRGQINTWMAEAFEAMGAPELIDQVPWNLNKRMTSARGRAGCTWKDGKACELFMEFSLSLFKLSDEDGRRQCVFHECAHIVDYHKGTYVKGQPHGISWKSYMASVGVEAKRCHNVQPVKQRRTKKWKASCACKVWEISSQRRRKMKLGEASYKCKKCGEKLALER